MKAFSQYITEKKIRVFDFDDTLVRTDGVIRVTTKNGLVKELSPAQYAVYDPKPGDSFDYSDFEKVLNPQPVKLFDYIVDPKGQRDLSAKHSDIVEKLQAIADKYLRIPRPEYMPVNIEMVEQEKEEIKKRLEQLGYK